MPSNYLQELDEDASAGGSAPAAPAISEPGAPEPAAAEPEGKGARATALYDYEAGEDNELSFPENAVITNIVSSTYNRVTGNTNYRNRAFQTRTGGTASTLVVLDYCMSNVIISVPMRIQ